MSPGILPIQKKIEPLSSAIVVYEVNHDETDFIFQNFNKQAEEIEDLKAEDILGKNLTDVFPRIKQCGLFDVLMQVYKTGESRIHPLNLYRDKNHHGWRRKFIVKTSPTQLTVSYQDAQIDYQNHYNVEVFKTILQFSSDAVAITDAKSTIEYVNESFINNTGYAVENLIGHKMNILRSGEHSDLFYQDMWMTLNRYEVWEGEIVNRHNDGHFFIDKTIIIPIYTEDKIITNFVTIKKDITDLRTKEQLFRQHIREAQMGEMIAIIAHQWKQPLCSLSASITNLSLCQELDNPMDGALLLSRYKSMLNTIDFLSHTVDDFRTFFSPKEKTSQENLSMLVSSTVEMLDNTLKSNEIKVFIDIDPELMINTYKNEIKHVFLNLLKNFIDIVEEKKIDNPQIRFGSTLDMNHIFITVEDNGGGIAPQYLDKMFLANFTTKTKDKGTGLGLYMSKLVLEEHCNGTIKVENSENGALFTIKLRII